MTVDKSERFILWFEEVGKDDVGLVGGKNASLGEMIQNLDSRGVAVPGGFAVTAHAYRYFIRKAGLDEKIRKVLSDLDVDDSKNLARRGKRVRKLIEGASFPADLRDEVVIAYRAFAIRLGIDNPDVAVRSSATAEDLPDASFAGQQETFLNVRGEEQLLEKVRECFASLFNDRAIFYREEQGFGHFDVYLSVAVQQMVRSDLASAGVMFTIDPVTGFKDKIVIEGAWGLGELVVQGDVTPDTFSVSKPTVKVGTLPLIPDKICGEKERKIIYVSGGNGTDTVEVPEKDRSTLVLNDEEIVQLAKWACIIEDHYCKPMDIEWAKDGKTHGLYIVQARPVTVDPQKDTIGTYMLEEPEENRHLLIEGNVGSPGLGRGEINVILSACEIERFQKGQILVTEMTDPDWVPAMKKAAAIVTDRGGRTCHAAIVSRELGVPCIVGSKDATSVLKTGFGVTVDCSRGQVGYVYDGLLDFRVEKQEVEIPKTRTQIMMNLGDPGQASEYGYGQITCEGVGLARVEFIINSAIGIHPLALVGYQELLDRVKSDTSVRNVVREIEERTQGYENKAQFFVDQFATGVAKIAAAFYPHDVIVRFSDFKTNEYRNLTGGEFYEPHEENPMIGWRGASRYYSEHYKRAFGLEVEAIKKVREEMGLTNVKVMIPFCRTPEEGKRVIETINEFGLAQGDNGLEIYVMAEIPSNVLQAEEFAEIFDGFSIGSNDLTQLTLGLDRDSELVSHLYDERNSSVKTLVRRLIEVVHVQGRKVGICGQAPSDFPEFAEFLVECGIDSISLNPDTVIKTQLRIAEKEKELGIS